MAKNRIFAQGNKHLRLPVRSGLVSGDPEVVGGALPCVLLTDRDADGNATVSLDAVFDIPVEAAAAAISPGHILYWDATAPRLSNTGAGVRFGYALEAVLNTATSTIRVQVGY